MKHHVRPIVKCPAGEYTDLMEHTDTVSLRWSGCGAFEIEAGDVNIAIDPYLFGPNLAAAEPIYDYIFITHEHFDHCHPPTLKKLCSGERFKMLYVPPGCIHPDTPIPERYGDAAFERDLPITKHIPAEKVQTVYPKHRAEPSSGRILPEPVELELGPLHVETFESGESQRPDLPTCGYLIEHRAKDLAFIHTGDMYVPYPSLVNLRGRADFLIHMKLGLTEWGETDQSHRLTAMLDYLRPRYLVPIHYRTDRLSDPVPEGHWPPNATDVSAFVESLRETVGHRATVLPFTAGVTYECRLPEKSIVWKWNWHNTWTVPPWRQVEGDGTG